MADINKEEASEELIERALRFGILNSTSVVNHTGAQPGLLSVEGLLEEEKKRRIKIEKI